MERWSQCACGCGERVHLPRRKFIKGHRPIVVRSDGYRRVWVTKHHPIAASDGNVLEHRLVLFNAGVEVPPGHHVHHKNGDKLDNRLENLEVMTESEHHRLHVRAAGFVVNQYGTWPLHAHGRGGEWSCR